MSNKKQLVVVGNGMVGHRFVESALAADLGEQYSIKVLCEEPRLAYDRVHLSEYFAGKSADDLMLADAGVYETAGIEVQTGVGAASIDREAKSVLTTDGEQLAYDDLVLATGSYPFVPPVPGHERDGCFVYRTLEDLDQIRDAAAGGKVGVVVGGGLLGLEAAKALRDLGLETHVVEFAPRLMAVQLDEAGGALLRRMIEKLGVTVHTSKNTTDIVEGDGHALKMQFADGESLETDLIVFSAGIRPRDELAREAGIELGPRGGISIDNHCRTSDDNIYAIGECALWGGQIFGLVAPGYQMAEVVAGTLAGETSAEFAGADMSTKLKLMGVDVASIGDAHASTPGAHVYVYNNGPGEVYKKLVVSEDNHKLLGAVLVGDADDYGTLLQYALNGIDLPAEPDSLILPRRDGAAVGLGVDALPDSAQICSCYNVSKGDIVAAIEGGVCDMAGLKAETSAGTGCGGCAALCKQVLDSELESRGVEVDHSICEHFGYTRQELFGLIRVGEIKSFDELLERYGTGRGCDICKPTVASILASCWNDYVLEDAHAPLQDSNDYYLGNIQKDGTYSIVPRMAGGEVTPDKLIALGQVAKKYDLYTKVTGGQRVDLFGARLEQLPAIWGELIDAGFETGHAYGKSVRTVKSCVGSTWCRYGVDDSVGLAVELEERYKGLRAPHKLKFAVSGCTRECAEAQCKDIGVIATENGWNLYVCGNGGMKPRHADLFASDLDRDTLIKYIDRVLMFYVATGDRLQRTARWLENLEGGLDYLREVVIDDKLGLGDELEARMQRVVDSYQCEWKTTIEDPEKVKRFRAFVNAEGSDSNVVFVRERDQIRPATAAEKSGESKSAELTQLAS